MTAAEADIMGIAGSANSDTAHGPVIYHEVRCRCPQCGHANPPVNRKIGPQVRHHSCPQCGHAFKSLGV